MIDLKYASIFNIFESVFSFLLIEYTIYQIPAIINHEEKRG